jgi:serine/threonine protein kinase
MKPDAKKYHAVGTPDYMAPEMINGTGCLNPSVDWWAIGCIIYELIVGIPPFNSDTREKVWDNALNQRITWPDIGYEENMMTPEAQDLILKLLNPDPEKRLSNLEEFKNHSFFKGFDWSNLYQSAPPLIPDLKSLNHSKAANTVPIEEIFEINELAKDQQGNKAAPKIKKKHLATVRHDILHEENLNCVVDTM